MGERWGCRQPTLMKAKGKVKGKRSGPTNRGKAEADAEYRHHFGIW